MRARGAGLAEAEGLIGELIRRDQLKRIAALPVMSGARQLAAEVAPVWSIVDGVAPRDYADIS